MGVNCSKEATMTRIQVAALTLVLIAAGALAQESGKVERNGQPTFKGYWIGETAQELFGLARIKPLAWGTRTDTMTTSDFCHSYLSDSTVLKIWDKVQKKRLNPPPEPHEYLAAWDVDGCRNVISALGGKDVDVSARFAALLMGTEKYSANLTFHAGTLVVVSLGLDAPYDDVLADMTKKLGAVTEQGEDVLQNAFGAKLTKRKATWRLEGLVARISELRSFREGNLGTSVFVADPAYVMETAKQHEASRPSTLD